MREKRSINIEIGNRVRTRRTIMNLSRDKLAEQTELSARFLACVENGFGGLSMTSLRSLANALHVSCDYLVMGYESDDLSAQAVEVFKRIRPEDIPLALKFLDLLIATTEHCRSE